MSFVLGRSMGMLTPLGGCIRSKAEPGLEGDPGTAGTDSKIQAEFVEAAKRAKVLQTRQRLKSTGSASLAEGGAEALKLLDARRDKRMDPRGESP